MRVSLRGIRFIAGWEGFSPVAYKFPGETYYTIGYGHYGPDVHPGQRISRHRARNLLRRDIAQFEEGVKRAVKRRLRQRDLDALVSFAYNNGLGAFTTSTLLRRWNAGENRCKVAREELPKWVHGSGGEVLPGLVRRRHAEAHLICTGKY